MDYNRMLETALTGRYLMEEYPPHTHLGSRRFTLWGEEAGLTGSDIHSSRVYNIYIQTDDTGVITEARVVIEGELLSPCSGYAYEALDEFDYPHILAWCLARTKEAL